MGHLFGSPAIVIGLTLCLLSCQESTDGGSDADGALMADVGVIDGEIVRSRTGICLQK